MRIHLLTWAFLTPFFVPLAGPAQDLGARKTELDEQRKKIANSDEAGALARAYMQLADDAGKADDYDVAIAAVVAAGAVAAKAGDVDLTQLAREKEKEYKKLKTDFAKVKEAEVKVAAAADPAAELTLGKFYSFTKNDWQKGLPHLAKCSDQPLKSAAEADLNAKAIPDQIAAAEQWVAAANKNAPVRSLIIEHALQLYRQAWEQSEGLEREKLRTKLHLIAGFPPQISSAGVPPGWNASHVSALNRVFVDSNFAHSGRRSLRFERDKDTDKGLVITDSAVYKAKPLKEYTLSLWVWSNRNTRTRSYIGLRWINASGGMIGASEIPLTADVPIWTKLSKSFICPDGAVSVDLQIGVSHEGKCTVFIDDVSVTMDGKEVFQNGSFETTDKAK
jgi:hypothetical protein